MYAWKEASRTCQCIQFCGSLFNLLDGINKLHRSSLHLSYLGKSTLLGKYNGTVGRLKTCKIKIEREWE